MSKSVKAVQRKEYAKSWWYSAYRHAREQSRSGKDNGSLDYCVMCCACNHGFADRLKELALLAAFGTRGDKLNYFMTNQARW